jgi:hypothetical protein
MIPPLVRHLVRFVAAAATLTVAAACASTDSSSTSPTTGTLQINVSGLPSGTNATVTVTSGSTTQNVTATQTLTLPPGSYTIGATSLNVATGRVVPNINPATVTITAGQTTTVAVTYAPAGLGTVAGIIGTSRTLSRDTVYRITGDVQITNGATLTIPAGTRLFGDTINVQTAIYVTRGARVLIGPATGDCSADSVVVMTSGWPAGRRQPGDWGGLTIVGNATANLNGPNLIEATPGVSITYTGGTNDADNSGRVRCLRSEFAGYAFGGGVELNAVTFYAVGRGTQVEYVQAHAGLDDQFQWQGGTVDARYLISSEGGDDDFDTTEGWRGRVQFAIAYSTTRLTPRFSADNTSSFAIEQDGCSDPSCRGGASGAPMHQSQPYTMGTFVNLTSVHFGTTPRSSVPTPGGDFAMRISTGTGGLVANSIFSGWAGGLLVVRDSTTWNQRFVVQDSLNFINIVAGQIGGGATAIPLGTGATSLFPLVLINGSNSSQQPAVAAYNWTPEGLTALATTATNATIFTAAGTHTAAGSAPDFTLAAGAGSAGTLGSGTGGTGRPLPAAAAALLNNYPAWAPAGAMPQTSYVGAAAPGGRKWWEGWTNWALN